MERSIGGNQFGQEFYLVFAKKPEEPAYKTVLYNRKGGCFMGMPTYTNTNLTLDKAREAEEKLIKRGYEVVIASRRNTIDLDKILFDEFIQEQIRKGEDPPESSPV